MISSGTNRITIASLLSAFALLGCSKASDIEQEPTMHTVSTEVYYRERMMPPPGSTLRLVMEDVAIQDIAATTIAELTIDDIGAPPYKLELNYEPSLIQQGGRYALRAQIRHDDRLLFTSTEHIEAFSPHQHGAVQIRMDHVPRRPDSRPDTEEEK